MPSIPTKLHARSTTVGAGADPGPPRGIFQFSGAQGRGRVVPIGCSGSGLDPRYSLSTNYELGRSGSRHRWQCNKKT